MKRIILTSLSAILFLFTLLFAWIFFTHLTLPYNDEGRYFDEDSMTVYKQQSVLLYGLITVVNLALTSVTIVLTKRLYKKKP